MAKHPDLPLEKMQKTKRLSAQAERRKRRRNKRAEAHTRRILKRGAKWASSRFTLDARPSYPGQLCDGYAVIELFEFQWSHGFFVVMGGLFRYLTPYDFKYKRPFNTQIRLSNQDQLYGYLVEI